MSTIKDVAKLAGVSISTASYALNNRPNVHPETKARILMCAKQLNYYPNGNARNLKARKTGNIGVFVYAFAGPIFSDILEGIRQRIYESDYNMIVSSGITSENLLNERQVDGAIVVDIKLKDDILINYANHGHPVFLLDRKLSHEHIYTSLVDNEGLVYEFIKDMIQKGYNDFAYLSGPSQAFNNEARYKGFKKALQEKNLEHGLIQASFTIKSGYEAGTKLAKIEKKPRFIFCANDESAIGLIEALKQNGIRIPDDVAVAGFDNIALDEYITPKLTTISIEHLNWGKHVAGALIDVLQGKKAKRVENPKGKIIYRESC